ncbi:MAG: M28 family peptidase [Blastocatellia bacterium]
MRLSIRVTSKVVLLAISLFSLSAYQAPPVMTDDVKAALAHISADSLRGHLSFIASDALEGRNTPSRGLDIAAEYIAAQFRRAGLEPVGDDGYFQTANLMLAERNMDEFELRIRDGKELITVSKTQVSLSFEGALNLARAGIIRIDYKDAAALAALKPEQTQGRIVITEIPDFHNAAQSQQMEMYRAQSEFISKVSALKAALILSVDRLNAVGSGSGQGRVIDPENRRAMPESAKVPLITVHDQKVVNLYDALKPGAAPIDATLKLSAPVERPVKARNVIGLLRGSDPALKDTYVMITAHYDHIGVRAGGMGDNIFNGANDDGSGTVSVIELASALATLKERPKRSLIFMTVFGEEKGLLGSRYYGRHPVFPIEKTVADVNLEQVGRTDSDEGPQLSNAAMTGFDFSDVGATFKAAGEMTGIKIYKHERNSDAYFGRSDNQALADQGVPAHTLSVAYVYPDYHGLGDHWDKIDYANMVQVDRSVALGVVMIANNPEEPKWNEANPKAARYVEAWKKRHGKPAK